MSRIEAMVGMSGVNMSEHAGPPDHRPLAERHRPAVARHRRQAPRSPASRRSPAPRAGDHHAGDLPVRADRAWTSAGKVAGRVPGHRRPAAGAGAHRALRHRSRRRSPGSTCRSEQAPMRAFLIGAGRAGGGGPAGGRCSTRVRFFSDRKQDELRRRLQSWAAARAAGLSAAARGEAVARSRSSTRCCAAMPVLRAAGAAARAGPARASPWRSCSPTRAGRRWLPAPWAPMLVGLGGAVMLMACWPARPADRWSCTASASSAAASCPSSCPTRWT